VPVPPEPRLSFAMVLYYILWNYPIQKGCHSGGDGAQQKPQMSVIITYWRIIRRRFYEKIRGLYPYFLFAFISRAISMTVRSSSSLKGFRIYPYGAVVPTRPSVLVSHKAVR